MGKQDKDTSMSGDARHDHADSESHFGMEHLFGPEDPEYQPHGPGSAVNLGEDTRVTDWHLSQIHASQNPPTGGDSTVDLANPGLSSTLGPPSFTGKPPEEEESDNEPCGPELDDAPPSGPVDEPT